MSLLFGDLVWECRFGLFGESALKDLLSNPDVHIAGVAYHKAAAEKATDPKIKKRHLAQIKHHSKEAEKLRHLLRHGGKGESLSINDVRFMLGESLAKSMRDKAKAEVHHSRDNRDDKAHVHRSKDRDDDSDKDDDGENDAREKSRAEFNKKWSSSKETSAERSHEMHQRLKSQERHKTMSGALKAIAGAAKSAVSKPASKS